MSATFHSTTTKFLRLLAMTLVVATMSAGTAWADGFVFITGHDPDFHAQGDVGAQILLKTGLNYVTQGTWNTPGHKFLWVESNNPVTSGHLFGENALTGALGLTLGVNFDHVDAAGLAGVNFANYSAIAVASSFGGMLTQAEINELIARKGDIQTFINNGGGLFASSECGLGFANCDASNITNNASLFGFLPLTATSVSVSPPFVITAFGQTIGAPFGLSTADLQDPTHNSFLAVNGLTAVDLDQNGNPTTLAGQVSVGNTGFNPTPEPSTLLLFCSGVVGLSGRAWKKLRR